MIRLVIVESACTDENIEHKLVSTPLINTVRCASSSSSSSPLFLSSSSTSSSSSSYSGLNLRCVVCHHQCSGDPRLLKEANGSTQPLLVCIYPPVMMPYDSRILN
jgi:hypothetical protein